MKRILDGVEIEMTESEITEFEQSRLVQFNIELFTQELSAAFDAKFTNYWRAKGYVDLSDLLSHAANPNSVYHAEALSLIQWSHDEWEAAIAYIDESSSIDEIINGLETYA